MSSHLDVQYVLLPPPFPDLSRSELSPCNKPARFTTHAPKQQPYIDVVVCLAKSL